LHAITDNEVVLYRQFLENILKNGAVGLETSKHGSAFICTENGAWFHNLVLFKSNEERLKYKNEVGDLICDRKACTIGTAVRKLKSYKANFNKPVALFVGQRLDVNEYYGHSWCVILYKDKNEWKIIVEDSRPTVDANIPTNVRELATPLGIRYIDLIAELP